MDKWINPTHGVSEFIADWSVVGDASEGYMPSGRYDNPLHLDWWDGWFCDLLNESKGFRQYMTKQLRPYVKAQQQKLLKVMPKNTYKGESFKSYRKGMKNEDAEYFKKHGNLKYHYTTNPKSIRRRTTIKGPYSGSGNNQGLLIIKYKSTAPHYNFLRWGFSKGGVQVYEGADWTKWFEDSRNDRMKKLIERHNKRWLKGYWDKITESYAKQVTSRKYWIKAAREYNEVSRRHGLEVELEI